MFDHFDGPGLPLHVIRSACGTPKGFLKVPTAGAVKVFIPRDENPIQEVRGGGLRVVGMVGERDATYCVDNYGTRGVISIDNPHNPKKILGWKPEVDADAIVA